MCSLFHILSPSKGTWLNEKDYFGLPILISFSCILRIYYYYWRLISLLFHCSVTCNSTIKGKLIIYIMYPKNSNLKINVIINFALHFATRQFVWQMLINAECGTLIQTIDLIRSYFWKLKLIASIISILWLQLFLQNE